MIAIAHPAPLFEVGQLVKHRRYGYRGVVLAVDHVCAAPRDWYEGNLTRPDRQQPWYHVIVDGRDTTTYPAQTSLMADNHDERILNPLVDMFFDAFVNRRYVRNDVTWQGW